jgi:hypothetical protein
VDEDDVAGQREQDEPAGPDAAAGRQRDASRDDQRAGVEGEGAPDQWSSALPAERCRTPM